MKEEIESAKKGGKVADHLANERTFLAWIRTSIALMGFGFVIVKFVIFIRQITNALRNDIVVHGKSNSATIGVAMVALGAIIALLAFLRYLQIEKQLNKDTYYPMHWLSILVTLTIVIGSILLVIYLLPNL
ncbi:YidH family protein [Kaistella jeonii]|uniref:Membrane protein n=1 Tax=Kaistella jeonii TaxID=266749 RepID=A0A0C1EZ84_9FLAO|nr:DUF202 domain-containing protein [Kaistella jeonii]KIA85068.1 membrane protein [Kaistella jeonii]SFC43956.1 putative membrane protein [Kaistella jeonii]VEI97365.1 Predicted membrane protein [Kaistella jeonii]